ncbi:hypothetical protein PoB_004202300 [Plakobranchus ocellatus]|uniref:Uncharacterized protein n=1 Tax=Plakobranchus ocellatus TaxID=259542 RepID=A0AAV4B7C9_9GAST|nr:hypothetical protein PoB_004202300 [Plakobranchus ocellatus]
MAYEDSFGFTHLVEDSDDDDNALDMSNSHLDVDLQPHLSSLETATSITDRTSVGDTVDDTAPENAHPGHDVSHVSSLGNGHYSTVGNGTRKTVPVGDIESAPVSMSSVLSSGGGDEGAVVNGSAGVHTDEPRTAVDISTAPVQTNVQVQFSNVKGQVEVVQQPVATRPDGSYYINTHGVPQQWSEPDRPLRKRRIRLLKIFSVVACVFFFPTGIPAAYYAFNIDREFSEGIIRGNIDRAQQFAKRSERLIVVSMFFSVVLGALIVALVERPYTHAKHHSSGPIVG